MTRSLLNFSGIEDPIAALEDLAHSLTGGREGCLDLATLRTSTSTRTVVGEMGVQEYLNKLLTRDKVQAKLRPMLLGDAEIDPADRGGHVISLCGAQGGAGHDSYRRQSGVAPGANDQGKGRPSIDQ